MEGSCQLRPDHLQLPSSPPFPSPSFPLHLSSHLPTPPLSAQDSYTAMNTLLSQFSPSSHFGSSEEEDSLYGNVEGAKGVRFGVPAVPDVSKSRLRAAHFRELVLVSGELGWQNWGSIQERDRVELMERREMLEGATLLGPSLASSSSRSLEENDVLRRSGRGKFREHT